MSRPYPVAPPVYARICAGTDNGDVWWEGLSPWPSLPVASVGQPDDTRPMIFSCCQRDAGPHGDIAEVWLHMPANLSDPSFTVYISMPGKGVREHLEKRHSFVAG
jgi:hypothetical protein